MENSPRNPPLALVTGARGGIGRALVSRLRASGHPVAVVGRDASTLRTVAADAHLVADTTTPEGAAAALAGCTDHWGGPPALLAHCVGNTLIAPLSRATPAQMREVLRVNLESALWMLQAWTDALRSARQPGVAVLVSSVVAQIGVSNHEAIAAAKGGIEALVRGAAASFAPAGLRINAVAPGMTETPMTAGMLRTDTVRDAAGKQYPLGGIQSADQVAAVMAWLLSDASARLTGQIIAVDGGFTSIRPLVR